jgi:ubiquinone/menaquinone biosynthesis C-methylase UbiE
VSMTSKVMDSRWEARAEMECEFRRQGRHCGAHELSDGARRLRYTTGGGRMANDNARKYSRKMFNRIASRYESTLAGRHSDRMKKAALQCLDQNIRGSVLDVGCGPGLLLTTLNLRYPDLHLAGLDIAPEMVRIARLRIGDGADIQLGDSECLPWPDSSFDYVFCVDSFHHYPNGRKVLLEFRRVLVPDGRLVLADPTAPVLLRIVMNSIVRLLRMGDVQMYDRRTITGLLERCGFRSIRWHESGSWGFVVCAIAHQAEQTHFRQT